MPLPQTLNQYNKAMIINHSKEYKNVITKSFKICIIQTTPFILLAKKQDHEIFTIIIKNIKKVLKLKQYINPQPLIPKKYYNIINKFKRQFTDQLPLH